MGKAQPTKLTRLGIKPLLQRIRALEAQVRLHEAQIVRLVQRLTQHEQHRPPPRPPFIR